MYREVRLCLIHTPLNEVCQLCHGYIACTRLTVKISEDRHLIIGGTSCKGHIRSPSYDFLGGRSGLNCILFSLLVQLSVYYCAVQPKISAKIVKKITGF